LAVGAVAHEHLLGLSADVEGDALAYAGAVVCNAIHDERIAF